MSDTSIEVPGASLRYRLCGTPSALPLLVFENGWGASFEQWTWIEGLLAPQTRLLFYDRAGIGGSRLQAPQTVAGLSAGFAALLQALNVDTPVVVVGHSYGGLMGSLHVAQQPQRVRALVQVDATPDRDEATIDAQLDMLRIVGSLSIGLARLGLPNPVFGSAGRMLPAPEGRQMMRRSFSNVASLRAGMAEFALLRGIRAAIAAQPVGCPALILSADRATEAKGLLARLVPPHKARTLIALMQSQHRHKAAQAAPGEWDALPHDHGALVFDQAGAQATATRLMRFVRELAAT